MQPPSLLLVRAFARFRPLHNQQREVVGVVGAFMVKTVAAKSCEPVSSASVRVLVVSSTFCDPNLDRENKSGMLNMTPSFPDRGLARCQGTRYPQRATAVVAEVSTKPAEEHSPTSRPSTLRKAADNDVSTDLIVGPEKSWKRSYEHVRCGRG